MSLKAINLEKLDEATLFQLRYNSLEKLIAEIDGNLNRHAYNGGPIDNLDPEEVSILNLPSLKRGKFIFDCVDILKIIFEMKNHSRRHEIEISVRKAEINFVRHGTSQHLDQELQNSIR